MVFYCELIYFVSVCVCVCERECVSVFICVCEFMYELPVDEACMDNRDVSVATDSLQRTNPERERQELVP